MYSVGTILYAVTLVKLTYKCVLLSSVFVGVIVMAAFSMKGTSNRMLDFLQNVLTFLSLVLMVALYAVQLWSEIERRKNSNPPV
jgi:hypothetical protein